MVSQNQNTIQGLVLAPKGAKSRNLFHEIKKLILTGNSPVDQWLGLRACPAGGMGSLVGELRCRMVWQKKKKFSQSQAIWEILKHFFFLLFKKVIIKAVYAYLLVHGKIFFFSRKETIWINRVEKLLTCLRWKAENASVMILPAITSQEWRVRVSCQNYQLLAQIWVYQERFQRSKICTFLG